MSPFSYAFTRTSSLPKQTMMFSVCLSSHYRMPPTPLIRIADNLRGSAGRITFLFIFQPTNFSYTSIYRILQSWCQYKFYREVEYTLSESQSSKNPVYNHDKLYRMPKGDVNHRVSTPTLQPLLSRNDLPLGVTK